MATEQITESADEQNYREICERITELNVSSDEKQKELAGYCLANPLRTSAVREHIDQLRGELEAFQSQRQRLFPKFAELKSRINGWA